jgi:hypothetical protein
MKTDLLRSAALFCAACSTALAAPLAAPAAVHTKPDRAAPTVTYLKAGTEPVAATSLEAVATTPAGWMAVELPGPFEVYVENKDLTKVLDVKPGVGMRLAPKPDAPVLAVAEKGDTTAITGVRGKWTQLSLEKKLTGFINVGGTAGYMPPIATSPATAAPRPTATPPAPTPMAPAPVAPGVYGTATPGQASPMVNLGDGGSASLPRPFAGKFVSTRRPFTPRRPFDYALNDDANKRYAYLDVSKLLLTEQIESYLDRPVVVFGAAKATADGKDIVIFVETLQLK